VVREQAAGARIRRERHEIPSDAAAAERVQQIGNLALDTADTIRLDNE
jgi:hypothetical protein